MKNKRLEKTNKAVSTLESRIAQLKRDSERLRIREHYTNERYKELLKREEDLERAEEAHVARYILLCLVHFARLVFIGSFGLCCGKKIILLGSLKEEDHVARFVEGRG